MKRTFIKEYDGYTLHYMIQVHISSTRGEIMAIEARTEPSVIQEGPDGLSSKFRSYLQRDLIDGCERFAELNKDEMREGGKVIGWAKTVWDPIRGG